MQRSDAVQQAAAAASCPSVREVIDYMASCNGIYQSFGIETLEAVPGRSRFAMRVRGDMTNSFGTCHGGVYFTLADLAIGFTCNSRNERSVTAGASIEFLLAAKTGDRLIVEAREIYREGRNGTYDAQISIDGGPVVALVRGRMRIVGGPVVPA